MCKKLGKELRDSLKFKCTYEDCQDFKDGKEFTKDELSEHLNKDCKVYKLKCKFCEELYKREDF